MPPPSSFSATLAVEQVRPATAAPVATFQPTNYEPGYAYPLVLWLHDSGGNEQELPQMMQHLSTQNYVAVAPRATQEALQGQDDWGQQGYDWVQEPNAIADTEQAVDEAIELARERFNIHPNRVFLLGQGEGGTMALRVAMQSPRRFSGVASFSGALPRHHSPFRNVSTIRNLPFLLAASQESPQYQEAQVCRDLKLLHSAGCSVSHRQYPGSDDLTTSMLADANRWMMELACTPVTSTPFC